MADNYYDYDQDQTGWMPNSGKQADSYDFQAPAPQPNNRSILSGAGTVDDLVARDNGNARPPQPLSSSESNYSMSAPAPAPMPPSSRPRNSQPDMSMGDNISGMVAPPPSAKNLSSPMGMQLSDAPAPQKMTPYGTPQVSSPESYQQQAREQVGAQPHRGFWRTLADVGTGVLAGVASGKPLAIPLDALQGGLHGGDYRYQNKVNARAGELQQADQSGQAQQQYSDKMYNTNQTQQTETDLAKRQQALNERKQDFSERQYDEAPDPKTNQIIGYNDQSGRYEYYDQDDDGKWQPTGIGAAPGKGQGGAAGQPKLNEKDIEDRAITAAQQQYQQKYPQGKPSPQWLSSARALGYDPSKPDSDPANHDALSAMSSLPQFSHLQRNLAPKNDPEFQNILAQSRVQERQRQQQSGSNGYGAAQNNSAQQGQPGQPGQQQINPMDLNKLIAANQGKMLDRNGKPVPYQVARDTLQQKYPGVDIDQAMQQYQKQGSQVQQPNNNADQPARRRVDLGQQPGYRPPTPRVRPAQPGSIANAPTRPQPAGQGGFQKVTPAQPNAVAQAPQKFEPSPAQAEWERQHGMSRDQNGNVQQAPAPQKVSPGQRDDMENQANSEYQATIGQLTQQMAKQRGGIGNLTESDYNIINNQARQQVLQKYHYDPNSEAPITRSARHAFHSAMPLGNAVYNGLYDLGNAILPAPQRSQQR